MTFFRTSFRSLAFRQTLAYYAAFIALGLYLASLGPTLPSLAKHTDAHLDQISILFAARSLGYLLGSMGIGKAYDRIPGHVLLAIILLGMGAMMALSPLIHLLWLLVLVMLILGIGEGGLDVGGNILLLMVHKRNVGSLMNGLHFFFGVGAFLSPIIFAQALLISGDVNVGYWALALYALPVALWILRTPSPVLLTKNRDRTTESINIALISLVSLFFFLYVGAEASFGGWIFTYSVSMKLGEPATAAYLTSAFWGALTAGRLLAIPIALRFRPGRIIMIDLLISLICMGIIRVFDESILAIWVATIGMGLAMASIFPTTLIVAEHRMRLSGEVSRWFFVGVGLGGMFLPWVIGQLFEGLGPQITTFFIAIDLSLALIVFYFILRYPLRDRRLDKVLLS